MLSRVCVIATAATAAVALSTGGVSGLTVCYPGCGPDDYTGISSSITPWTDRSISLPKFDSAGTDRQLTKVTISTKVFFQTEVFVKCTADNCDTSFTGETIGGVRFGINPSTSNSATLRANLPQYWGRWGAYDLSHPETQFDINKRNSQDSQGNNIFVPYTYPFFDIPSFVPQYNKPDGEEAALWAYLANDGVMSRIFYATDNTTYDSEAGTVITFSNLNVEGVPETYADVTQYAGSPKVLKFGVGSTVPTPYNTEVFVANFTFDGTTSPYTKSISLDDYPGTEGGGINNNIMPKTMLALFTDPTSSGEQIVWDTVAIGFAGAETTGGNFVARQVTTGYAQMQIQYEYTGPAITH